MKAEFINPLVDSLSRVFNEVTRVTLVRGNLFLRTSPISLQKVIVVVGVTGEVRGQVVISLGPETAMKVASKMMMGMEVVELDEISKSAIGELGNIVAGNYATELANMEYKVDITAPIVLSGTNMELSAYNQKQIAIPFSSELGDIVIDVSISEDK